MAVCTAHHAATGKIKTADVREPGQRARPSAAWVKQSKKHRNGIGYDGPQRTKNVPSHKRSNNAASARQFQARARRLSFTCRCPSAVGTSPFEKRNKPTFGWIMSEKGYKVNVAMSHCRRKQSLARARHPMFPIPVTTFDWNRFAISSLNP